MSGMSLRRAYAAAGADRQRGEKDADIGSGSRSREVETKRRTGGKHGGAETELGGRGKVSLHRQGHRPSSATS